MRHGRPVRLFVTTAGTLGISFHYSPRYHDGWRREHAQRAWQAVQCVLYVAALDEAHQRFVAADHACDHEWGEGSEACKAANELMAVRWGNV